MIHRSRARWLRCFDGQGGVADALKQHGNDVFPAN